MPKYVAEAARWLAILIYVAILYWLGSTRFHQSQPITFIGIFIGLSYLFVATFWLIGNLRESSENEE